MKSQPTDINEAQLIIELRNNSMTAYTRLYRMYAPQLYRFCLMYTKKRQDAEEIVQDVFVRLWNIRHQLRITSTLRPLLFIMAKNYILNAIRSNANAPVYEDYLNYSDAVADKSYSAMEYDEFLKCVHNGLAQLPVNQRRAIVMSRLQGMSTAEIAEVLNISERTVYNNIHIGLKSLKIILKQLLTAAVLLISGSFL